jgi:SAM-dependent methyltransferase
MTKWHRTSPAAAEPGGATRSAGPPRQTLRQRLRRLLRPARLGTLRRTTPLSAQWGFDRGTPVDRYYIEQFLAAHRADIQGRVLEIKDSAYTDRLGAGVTRRDVLDISPANPLATFVADLAAADHVPSSTFDCFILTQTLHLIYDTPAAIRHAHRVLRPGGVLLATLPALSRVSAGVGTGGDYWRFTVASAAALFGAAFGAGRVAVGSRGNVLSAVAFLTGMAGEELRRPELEADDPYFPVLITVRAVKR